MDVFDPSGKSIFETSVKKKKKYILFLYSSNVEEQDKIRGIEKAIQSTLRDYILVRLEEPDEGLKAIIVKNIEIIIIDSSLFNDDATAVEYACECKKRKKCPILFIANRPKDLIQEYREKLFAYEEFDNYFNQPLEIEEFKKKLLQVSKSAGRAAKRFFLNIPVRLYRLNDNKIYNVILSDISLVGYSIQQNQEEIFSKMEQVQIKIPLKLFRIFHPQYADFLPLSGKVRRVSINGVNLGISIEFINPLQIEVLCEILSVLNFKAKMTIFSDKPKEVPAKKR